MPEALGEDVLADASFSSLPAVFNDSFRAGFLNERAEKSQALLDKLDSLALGGSKRHEEEEEEEENILDIDIDEEGLLDDGSKKTKERSARRSRRERRGTTDHKTKRPSRRRDDATSSPRRTVTNPERLSKRGEDVTSSPVQESPLRRAVTNPESSTVNKKSNSNNGRVKRSDRKGRAPRVSTCSSRTATSSQLAVSKDEANRNQEQQQEKKESKFQRSSTTTDDIKIGHNNALPVFRRSATTEARARTYGRPGRGGISGGGRGGNRRVSIAANRNSLVVLPTPDQVVDLELLEPEEAPSSQRPSLMKPSAQDCDRRRLTAEPRGRRGSLGTSDGGDAGIVAASDHTSIAGGLTRSKGKRHVRASTFESKHTSSGVLPGAYRS